MAARNRSGLPQIVVNRLLNRATIKNEPPESRSLGAHRAALVMPSTGHNRQDLCHGLLCQGNSYCEHSKSSSPKGQGRARLYTRDLIEQTTTVCVGDTRYLVRAYIRLALLISIHPFEIVEIVKFDCKKQFRHRFAAGSVELFEFPKDDNFLSLDVYLKTWAAAFLGAHTVCIGPDRFLRPYGPPLASPMDSISERQS
jgi:hypothetical protein